MNSRRFLALVDQMARMALKADASRMFLGYLWWMLEPLLYVAVFYLVFDVILDSGRADFLVFLVCGKLPYMWFSGTVNSASYSIAQARGLIGKTALPKLLLPMARVQEGVYRQSAVFAMLLLIVLVAGYEPSWTWLWLLPLALVQYLLIVPCAVAAALLVCVARDFARMVSLGTVFLLFVSGIFWDVRAIPSETTQQFVFAVNPIAFLLDAYRQVLMQGTAPDALHLAVLGAVAALACLATAYAVSRLEQWLALRVLSL
jgi:lipopolysaccharide transport system permease protein